jgi:hypothetical protein
MYHEVALITTKEPSVLDGKSEPYLDDIDQMTAEVHSIPVDFARDLRRLSDQASEAMALPLQPEAASEIAHLVFGVGTLDQSFFS